MATIELECPGCRKLLQLDAGFAGGVCRCSHCGTLMTVPSDTGREQPERVTRPERPGRRADPPEATSARAVPTGQAVEDKAPPPPAKQQAAEEEAKAPTGRAGRKKRRLARVGLAVILLAGLLVAAAVVAWVYFGNAEGVELLLEWPG